MNFSFQITDIVFKKGFYQPGETVDWQLIIKSRKTHTVQLNITIRYLDRIADTWQVQLDLCEGSQTIDLQWKTPTETPRGYGLDISGIDERSGEVFLLASHGFDVLRHWTDMPRYAFLTDFSTDRDDPDQTLDFLSQFHINALQFYDWMYRHEQLLPEEDDYQDPLGRPASFPMIRTLINSAHQRGMAAMPYTAIYGASESFYKAHPDWAVCEADGQPARLGEDFLVIMDPRLNSPWTQHLLAQFENLLSNTEFDGIHLDQYGYPRAAHDGQGQPFDIESAFAETINATKALAQKHNPDHAVTFNAVTNWPIEKTAPTDQDFIYIEVWQPYVNFIDLNYLINNAQALSGNKAVVLSAYIDPKYERNVMLTDAIIFASGGTHIEIGEHEKMLMDPYFPNYAKIPVHLSAYLRKLYDFAVRYQNVTGPQTTNANPVYQTKIQLEDIHTEIEYLYNIVFPIFREHQKGLTINLINLYGVDNRLWNGNVKAPPEELHNHPVRVEGIERKVGKVWIASPDFEDLLSREIEFIQENDALSFRIPLLAYWDMIVVEWQT
jgi:dextranase